MKTPRITNAIGFIGDDLVSAAENSGNKKQKRSSYLKWIPAAACLAVLVTAGAVAVPFLSDSGEFPNIPSVTGGSDTSNQPSVTNTPATESNNIPSSKKYKYQISAAEDNIVWPWEYMTTGEKFGCIYYYGNDYNIKSNIPISEDLLGDVLGTCQTEVTDENSGQKYTETFDVRKINGVSEEKLAAFGKDGEFYVYAADVADKPTKFGELSELYGLPQNLSFNHFTVCEGYEEKGHYDLSDDNYIWQVLSECGNADRYEKDDFFDANDRSYLTFTATSEALGVYKRVVYISEDGYFATNIFDYSYIYFIGEDSAKKIIDYAKNNSAESEPEPFEPAVGGKLTEIGEGYVLIDDSVLCENEEDGTVYKVIADDIRMKRYTEYAGVKVGDIVVVRYRGEISDNNQISGAYSIDKGILTEGDISIPE